MPTELATVALTGRQKAAAVLAQLGTERAAKVLKAMTEMEVVGLMEEMAKLPSLNSETVEELMEEFANRAVALVTVGQGGIEAARRLLRERLGVARAEEVLAQIETASAVRPLSFLQRIDPVQVSSFLSDEHPQTIAMVLAHLPSDFSAQVFSHLDQTVKAEIALRIARMGRVPPDVVKDVADLLETKLAMAVRAGGIGLTVGGVPGLVGILNNSERSAERQILSELEEVDADLAEEVRSQMFVFDDVVALDDRTLQRLLRNVVPHDLALALKGASEEVLSKFQRNMSERAAMDLVEEIEILGPTRLSAVEAAQSAIVRTVRDMESNGEIVLNRGDDELVA